MMKLGTYLVSINPLDPVKQCGFIQQVNLVSQVHDDLFLRIVVVEKEDSRLVYCVNDNIGISVEQSQEMRQAIQKHYSSPTEVITSCTHTHFAGDPHDETYFNQLKTTTLDSLPKISMRPMNDLKYSFQSMAFNGVGSSRISDHKASVFLDLMSLYEGSKRVVTFVIHNCHPTIMSGLTPFFSSEYPGYAMSALQKDHPDEFFLFMQGADGDISTRFTRKDQSYDEVKRLGTVLKEKVEELFTNKLDLNPFDFKVTKHLLPLKHRLLEVDSLPQNPNPSDREKETIEIGRKVLENIRPRFSSLPKTLELTKIDYGHYCQVYAPNELFSYYLKATPKSSSSLICYSQGYAPYVAGLEPMNLSYELFSDTYTDETKLNLYTMIYNLTQGS
jgi:neutral ceramidase